MKKAIIVFLALALCTFFVACGKDTDHRFSETDLTAPETTGEPDSETHKISNALYLCQFVKDCLAEPDSFQLHGVSYMGENERHLYYLDFSHEIKNSQLERTYYFAEFDGSTLLCIVNENSAICYQTEGSYTEKYSALSALFQNQGSEMLDVEWILANLN